MRWPWLKRAIHSKGFFLATLIVLITSVALFAGTNYSGEVSARVQIENSIAQFPFQFQVGTGSLLSASNYQSLSDSVGGVNGVRSAELRTSATFRGNVSGGEGMFQLYGVPNTSEVFSGVRFLSGSLSASPGRVYVWSASVNASRLNLGDSIEANFSIFVSATRQVNIVRTLVVGGFVDINQRALEVLTDVVGFSDLNPASGFAGTVLLTDWTSTVGSLIDSAISQGIKVDPFGTGVFVSVNTADFSSLDFQASTSAAEQLQARLQAEASKFGAGVFGENFLSTLQASTLIVESARLTFIVAALPVLLIAWYLVSVLFSILWKYRRRDLALCLTRGFSRSQILRMSLFEGLLIGGMGTIFGVVLGTLFSLPLIDAAGFNWTQIAFGESLPYAVVFGLATSTLFTVYPSWKMVQVPIAQSLEDLDRTESSGVSRHGFVEWVIFLIGLFGTIASLLSLDLSFNIEGTLTTGLLAQIWNLLPIPLVVLAPFLLLWGSARLLAGSGLVERVSAALTWPIVGGLTWISTRSLRTNLSWLVKFTVLLGLIVSYLVLSPAFTASQTDYQTRSAKSIVGADLAISMATLPNETVTHSRALSVAETLKSWQGVDSVTVEYASSLTLSYGGIRGTIPVMIVDPVSWPTAAYYEDEWFSSNPGNLFVHMMSDNQTIILSKDYVLPVTSYFSATPLNSIIPFQATYSNQTTVKNLRIIGFFGPAWQTPHIQAPTRSWSYVPEGLFGNSNPSLTTATVLLKTSNVEVSTLEDKISSTFSGAGVVSAADLAQTLPTDSNVSVIGTIFSMGLLPTAAASLVGLVALVFESLWLERRENDLLLIKGVTRSKLRGLCMSRFLPLIAIFGALGLLVGYALLIGLVSLLDAGELGLVVIKPVLGSLVPVVILSYLAILLFVVFVAIRIETNARTQVYS